MNGKGARILVFRARPPGELVGRDTPSLRIVMEGEERYDIDGRTYRLGKGQMLLMPAGSPFRVGSVPGPPTRSLAIELPPAPSDVDDPAVIGTPLMLPVTSHEVGSWLAGLAERLARIEDADGDAAAEAMRSIGEAVAQLSADGSLGMARLAAARERTRSELLSRVEVARSHIEANLHRSVQLPELAGQALISPFHLARAFRDVTGLAPAAYHRERRLEAARRLLVAGKRPGEVAAALGFAGRSTFNRTFVRRFGHPPGETRGS